MCWQIIRRTKVIMRLRNQLLITLSLIPKGAEKLRAYVERSQQTIDTKAEIMLEHFVPHVVNTKKLKGKGKGMVVTQNIEAAIRYYKAIRRILEEQGTPLKLPLLSQEPKKLMVLNIPKQILMVLPSQIPKICLIPMSIDF